MENQFIDDDNKIITECPNCSNQYALYLVSSNKIVEGLVNQWCDNCELPYVIDVKTELKCKIQIYKCEKSE